MGMLLSHHEGYWPEDAQPDEPKPGSKAALLAEAEALGLSTDGTKAEVAERIEAHKAEQVPDAGPDAGDNPDAPAPDGEPGEHDTPEDNTPGE